MAEAPPDDIGTSSSDEEGPRPPQKRRSLWHELPVLVVVAFVVALVIKTFLLQAFYIPSPSMEPTLVLGDRVLVEKISGWFGDPERGQVVVFERESVPGVNPSADDPFWTDIANAFRGLLGFPTAGKQDFIKRVIGVEGDTVEGRDGRVIVNGEAIEEPYLTDGTITSDFGPTSVPDGMLFVMGDNRGNSDDSRSFGPIDADSVVGRAFVLIWPPGDIDTL